MKLLKSFQISALAVALSTTMPVWAAEHPVTGEKLSDNQTFTYRVLDEFPTLDPQLVEETVGADIVRDLFEGLMNQDAEGNLVPGVAESFEASDDNKVFTFKLREDAKWSNGDPVLAGDFVYGWQRAADPATASPYAWFMELTTVENAAKIIAGEMPPESMGITAIDDYTLEVRLENSLPYFPLMTTHYTLYPANRKVIEEHGGDWTKPGIMVSNGAYILTEHVPNEKSVRERNEMYWDNENTIMEKVTALVINDENAALTRYLADEIDYTEVPAGQFPRLKKEYPNEATSVPRLCSYYYTFNLSESGREEFRDVRVRQALSYAIDRNVIVDQVLQGGQYPSYNFTHQKTAGFEIPDIEYAQWTQAERDAKAKELLAEAGYGPDNPLQFEMMYNTSESHKKIATVMAQMWKSKLGVEVTQTNMEWKTYLDVRGKQGFELARGAWCGDYNEASTFLDLVTTNSGYNDGKFSNPKVDELMLESRTMANPQPNYTMVEQIMADEMPIIPIYHYTIAFMLDEAVKGWPYENVEKMWYSKDMYRVAE
ncbi:MAG: peptide ABC transporter substrate-binding protein [Pseudomonadota bacterium]